MNKPPRYGISGLVFHNNSPQDTHFTVTLVEINNLENFVQLCIAEQYRPDLWRVDSNVGQSTSLASIPKHCQSYFSDRGAFVEKTP
jgi:hypothetical protein